MKKKLRRCLPDRQSIRDNRWMRPFADLLFHPRLWHLNRHSAAGAVATGLFCGLIPGPFQMLSATLVCSIWRVNLPLALLTTLYTNPLTIVPLYVVAYTLGSWTLGIEADPFIAPPELGTSSFGTWLNALWLWMGSLGKPLAIGMLELAFILAVLGYFLVRAAWRVWLIHNWRQRQQRHHASKSIDQDYN